MSAIPEDTSFVGFVFGVSLGRRMPGMRAPSCNSIWSLFNSASTDISSTDGYRCSATTTTSRELEISAIHEVTSEACEIAPFLPFFSTFFTSLHSLRTANMFVFCYSVFNVLSATMVSHNNKVIKKSTFSSQNGVRFMQGVYPTQHTIS